MGKRKSRSKAASIPTQTNTKSSEVDELERLFESAKKPKANPVPKAKNCTTLSSPAKAKERQEKSVQGSKDDLFGKAAKTSKRKRTTDGLAIYTEDELHLHLGTSGQTVLCPFDCECCF